MKRGELYAVIGKGDFASKPRPALIVQNDLHNNAHPSISVCPITSTTTTERLYRVRVQWDEHNGLKFDSEIQVDKVQAIWRTRLSKKIGQADEQTMFEVDAALRRWFDL